MKKQSFWEIRNHPIICVWWSQVIFVQWQSSENSRVIKREGCFQRHHESVVELGLGFTEDIFHSLLGGCCSVTVGGDLPYRQSTMSSAFTTGKRVQWNRARALESYLCSHHSSQTNLLDDLGNNPSSLWISVSSSTKWNNSQACFWGCRRSKLEKEHKVCGTETGTQLTWISCCFVIEMIHSWKRFENLSSTWRSTEICFTRMISYGGKEVSSGHTEKRNDSSPRGP